MKVKLQQGDKYTKGFKAYFQYNPVALDIFKRCVGFQWDIKQKVWYSEGPEVLLDMQRFGIEIEDFTPYARQIAEKFRDELTEAMKVRAQPFPEEEFGYQEQGIEWMRRQAACILADDKGLGKTRQAILSAARTDPRSVLVVPPATLNFVWLDQVNLWWPGVSVGVLPEGKTERAKFWANPPTVIIANYEKTILGDWPEAMNFDVVIFDEASSKLKNWVNKSYKRAAKLIKNSKHAWLLTANPLEISLDDLYALFSLIRPAVLGNYMRFQSHHVKRDSVGEVVDVNNLGLLRERIGPWILRRTKAEALPYLPPKLYTNFHIEMSPAEKKVYKEMTKDFDAWASAHGSASDGLVKTLRMRQFCCTPAIFQDPKCGRGSKYEALVETLKNHPDHSVVFCFFKEAVMYLHDWLQQETGDIFQSAINRALAKKPIDYNPSALITGDVSPKRRNEIIKAFNAGELGKTLLCTDAANLGVTITGANLVVHYDQLWNPQLMSQREDRTHRIGQKSSVQIVNLLVKDSIDIGMYDVCREREKLFDDVIEGAEETMIKKLSPDRLKNLVRGRPL